MTIAEKFARLGTDFAPGQEGEEAGLLLTQNERFSYLLVKERRGGQDTLVCWRVLNGKREELASVPVDEGRLYLYIEGRPGLYSFYWGLTEHDMRPLLKDADGAYLSTLVADGYVGVLMGMYIANGRAPRQDECCHADFDWFRYEAIGE